MTGNFNLFLYTIYWKPDLPLLFHLLQALLPVSYLRKKFHYKYQTQISFLPFLSVNFPLHECKHSDTGTWALSSHCYLSQENWTISFLRSSYNFQKLHLFRQDDEHKLDFCSQTWRFLSKWRLVTPLTSHELREYVLFMSQSVSWDSTNHNIAFESHFLILLPCIIRSPDLWPYVFRSVQLLVYFISLIWILKYFHKVSSRGEGKKEGRLFRLFR